MIYHPLYHAASIRKSCIFLVRNRCNVVLHPIFKIMLSQFNENIAKSIQNLEFVRINDRREMRGMGGNIHFLGDTSRFWDCVTLWKWRSFAHFKSLYRDIRSVALRRQILFIKCPTRQHSLNIMVQINEQNLSEANSICCDAFFDDCMRAALKSRPPAGTDQRECWNSRQISGIFNRGLIWTAMDAVGMRETLNLGPDKSLLTGRNIKSPFGKTRHWLRIRIRLAAAVRSKVPELHPSLRRTISVRFNPAAWPCFRFRYWINTNSLIIGSSFGWRIRPDLLTFPIDQLCSARSSFSRLIQAW
jgi:hypothetical protein